ncbi:MAG: hypothetical protein ABR501_08585 [Pyrinomonadaceae bacterium]
MKPLISESEDSNALRVLGRATVQIVHDLKNQLNGLKLYATFLRKRMEKRDGPADELETIRKLISGLDRTATDLSLIVEYGQPLELEKSTGTDLAKIMTAVASSLSDGLSPGPALAESIVIDGQSGPMIGEFDSARLSKALKSISLGAMKLITNKPPQQKLTIHLKSELIEARRNGVIEWQGFHALDHDPFHSFAGSDEIRMSLAARIVEAHGGSAERQDGALRVRLPLST